MPHAATAAGRDHGEDGDGGEKPRAAHPPGSEDPVHRSVGQLPYDAGHPGPDLGRRRQRDVFGRARVGAIG